MKFRAFQRRQTHGRPRRCRPGRPGNGDQTTVARATPNQRPWAPGCRKIDSRGQNPLRSVESNLQILQRFCSQCFTPFPLKQPRDDVASPSPFKPRPWSSLTHGISSTAKCAKAALTKLHFQKKIEVRPIVDGRCQEIRQKKMKKDKV